MTEACPGLLHQFARALGLPEDADEAAIVASIQAYRVLEGVETLAQVRERLALPDYADAMDCTAELCRRLPGDRAGLAVATVYRVERKERVRQAWVDVITSVALRNASAALGK